MTLAAIVDALSSKKGGALLAPAILLDRNRACHRAEPASAARRTGAQDRDRHRRRLQLPRLRRRRPRRAEGGLNAAQRKEVEAIIKDYLLSNPEVMMEVQSALEAKMDKIQTERTALAIKQNATEIFRPVRLACRRQCQGRRNGDRVLRLQLPVLQEGIPRGGPARREELQR